MASYIARGQKGHEQKHNGLLSFGKNVLYTKSCFLWWGASFGITNHRLKTGKSKLAGFSAEFNVSLSTSTRHLTRSQSLQGSNVWLLGSRWRPKSHGFSEYWIVESSFTKKNNYTNSTWTYSLWIRYFRRICLIMVFRRYASFAQVPPSRWGLRTFRFCLPIHPNFKWDLGFIHLYSNIQIFINLPKQARKPLTPPVGSINSISIGFCQLGQGCHLRLCPIFSSQKPKYQKIFDSSWDVAYWWKMFSLTKRPCGEYLKKKGGDFLSKSKIFSDSFFPARKGPPVQIRKQNMRFGMYLIWICTYHKSRGDFWLKR